MGFPGQDDGDVNVNEYLAFSESGTQFDHKAESETESAIDDAVPSNDARAMNPSLSDLPIMIVGKLTDD